MKLKGFPRRYHGLPAPEGEKWWSYFKDASQKVADGGIVVMYGGHGTGKTRMAYMLADEAEIPRSTYKRGGIVTDLPRIYTTAVGLFMDLRDSFRKESQISEKDIVRDMSEAALLVIDEIQERGETAFEDRKLTQIIDARYMDGRPTILISNYDRKRFSESLSPAVLDRIRENGLGLHFDWSSFRAKAAI